MTSSMLRYISVIILVVIIILFYDHPFINSSLIVLPKFCFISCKSHLLATYWLVNLSDIRNGITEEVIMFTVDNSLW